MTTTAVLAAARHALNPRMCVRFRGTAEVEDRIASIALDANDPKATWSVAGSWYVSIPPGIATDRHPSGTVMSLACWSTLVGS